MKRFNSQSTKRKIKRGHLRFIATEIVNKDGSRKIITQKKSNRGIWVNVSIN